MTYVTWAYRRGAQEVAGLVAELCCAADSVRAAISGHMAREEAAVLPLLQVGSAGWLAAYPCLPAASSLSFTVFGGHTALLVMATEDAGCLPGCKPWQHLKRLPPPHMHQHLRVYAHADGGLLCAAPGTCLWLTRWQAHA